MCLTIQDPIHNIKNQKSNHNTIYILTTMGGQDLSFCVGLKVSFTNESTSEEEKMFGKAP